MRLAYSYKITNNLNSRFYIGVRGCRKNTDIFGDDYWGSGKLIRRAINKKGKENFTKEMLFIFSSLEEALLWEKDTVTEHFMNENILCYNLWPGGNGGSGSGKRNGRYGKHASVEEKRKARAAKLGKLRPDIRDDNNPAKRPAVRAKISSFHKGKPKSEEVKGRISISQKKRYENGAIVWNKGKKGVQKRLFGQNNSMSRTNRARRAKAVL